ncbi:MAG: hypothetical protein JOZ42_13250 [Acetobacteraceae bacterium]|nr:hypothetical protein [Acetobacteraceae bacterium]
MARVFSAELSRRSLFLAAGRIELAGEWRTADWPRQWSYLVEPGSRELWLGRLYICVARKRASHSLAVASQHVGTEAAAARECQILSFKAPVRAI